ncbi:MAG: DUF4258 domain-containing protein [Bacteroidetes bacterium]|nr:DUF4258 domain-containing protein [Bacteroidota bacterium]
MSIVLSKHAKQQISLRGVSEEIVWSILHSSNFFGTEDGLSVYHGTISENNKMYLIRIFVNERVNPNLVVTVYKTSKINKYLT